jgi:hypothetical protein
MKKLYLLSILFIVSCATSNSYYGFPKNTEQTTLERATTCEIENFNKYYGDCWVQKSYQDKNFLEWVSALNMWDSWALIKKLNQDLKFKISLNQIDPIVANRTFTRALIQIDEITNLKIQRNVESVDRQVAIRNQKIAMALGSISQSINKASQPSYGNNNKFKNIIYYKRDEIDGGDNKICVYEGMGTKITRTIGSLEICPLTITE